MSKVEDISKRDIQEIGSVEQSEIKKASEPKKREQWGNSLEFFISALGYAVGVGNVWRFPYLCYNNGGGVFLIPYFICMVLLGIPLVYLEMIVGQFTSNGCLLSWRMVKVFKGIGLAMCIANSLVIIYYNMIIAYSLYYLFMSLTTELPWLKCDPVWSSNNCVDDFSPEKFTFTNCKNPDMLKCEDSFNFGRCFNATKIGGGLASCVTSRDSLSQIGWWKTTFPSEDFWNEVILNKSSSIEESGVFMWQLLIALFASWLIIYLMVIRGIKVSGKLVWFTALFPYVVLVILGVRGWMLPGADIGITFYTSPNWSKLLEIRVWRDAATQIFFTLAISYGGMNTLASYNKFNQNIQRDAILIPLANCLTSFFAGFVIFAYMGYLSKITQQDIGNIIQAGQGLAFVVYPYAVTTIKGAPFWSCLFFIMMTLLGIDSTMTCVETSITSICDAFPNLKNNKVRRYSFITMLSCFYFLCGLIFCFQWGTYWMEFFAAYAGDWAVLCGGLIECVVVSYFYGLKNIRIDLECMLGKNYKSSCVHYIWCSLWAFLTPSVILVLIIITFINFKVLTLGDYVFPEWTLVLGIMMTSSSLVGFLTWVLYEVYDTLFIKKKPFGTLFIPDLDNYQPMLEEDKITVRIARGLEKENDNVEEFPPEFPQVSRF